MYPPVSKGSMVYPIPTIVLMYTNIVHNSLSNLRPYVYHQKVISCNTIEIPLLRRDHT